MQGERCLAAIVLLRRSNAENVRKGMGSGWQQKWQFHRWPREPRREASVLVGGVKPYNPKPQI